MPGQSAEKEDFSQTFASEGKRREQRIVRQEAALFATRSFARLGELLQTALTFASPAQSTVVLQALRCIAACRRSPRMLKFPQTSVCVGCAAHRS